MVRRHDDGTVAVIQRLDEIRSGYGPDHVVRRFVDRAQGEIVEAVERTQERLDKAGEE